MTSQTAPDPRHPSDVWHHRAESLALFVLAGAALALIATRDEIAPAEQEVFFAFNHLGSAWWPMLATVMQVGTLSAGPTLGFIAAVTRRRFLAFELAVGGPVAWLVARVLKALVNRPRPGELLDGVVIRGGEVGGLGYPSGHVTVAATLAAILSSWLPLPLRVVVWVAVAAVAAARMYVGAHLPLDVLGGLLLGLVVGALVRHAALRFSDGSPPGEISEQQPPQSGASSRG